MGNAASIPSNNFTSSLGVDHATKLSAIPSQAEIRCLLEAAAKKLLEVAKSLGDKVRMHACIYVCMYLCMYVCVCMYVCMYVYVYVCVCVSEREREFACLFVCLSL